MLTTLVVRHNAASTSAKLIGLTNFDKFSHTSTLWERKCMQLYLHILLKTHIILSWAEQDTTEQRSKIIINYWLPPAISRVGATAFFSLSLELINDTWWHLFHDQWQPRGNVSSRLLIMLVLPLFVVYLETRIRHKWEICILKCCKLTHVISTQFLAFLLISLNKLVIDSILVYRW